MAFTLTCGINPLEANVSVGWFDHTMPNPGVNDTLSGTCHYECKQVTNVNIHDSWRAPHFSL